MKISKSVTCLLSALTPRYMGGIKLLVQLYRVNFGVNCAPLVKSMKLATVVDTCIRLKKILGDTRVFNPIWPPKSKMADMLVFSKKMMSRLLNGRCK